MTRARFGPILFGWLAVAVFPALAHHSSSARYDEASLITLTGKVTKVAWNNPHVILYVAVPGEGGLTANWQMEMGSPNGLLQLGWKVDSVKPGDQVTVSGFRAKDGSHAASARKVVIGGQSRVYAAPGDSRAAK
jgi:uncharacterized protein DUF6152